MIRTWTKMGHVPGHGAPDILFGADGTNDSPSHSYEQSSYQKSQDKGRQERRLIQSILFQVAQERDGWCVGDDGACSFAVICHPSPSIEELKLVATRFDELLREMATITKEYQVKIE